MYLISVFLVNSARVKTENASVGAAIVFFLISLILTELIFYVQTKAQVKLFIASRVNKFQEKQLFNMLDSMPAKVLVCSQEHGDIQPEPMYNNRPMKNFFGGSLLEYENNSAD